jgi:hypothetical protein
LAATDHFLYQRGLFRAKERLFWSEMGFFGSKMIWGSKRTFLGFINVLRPTGTFLGQKWIFIANFVFIVRQKILKKAGFGKNRLFLRPMSTFWTQKGHFKPI